MFNKINKYKPKCIIFVKYFEYHPCNVHSMQCEKMYSVNKSVLHVLLQPVHYILHLYL